MATSSNTETLIHENPTSSTHEEQNHQPPLYSYPLITDQQPDGEDEEQQSGNSLSPRPYSVTSPTNHSRRYTTKRKKGPFNAKKQQAIEKKVQTLTENFNPVPFIPSKLFDFSKHEKLLKHLGLWDFVHIDFDQDIRVDLIAQLITSYDKTQRNAYVKGNRIMVARPNLARAIMLPLVKKQKANPTEGVDLDSDSEFASDECKLFLEDFVSNWVLLHEDTWMMPDDVLHMIRPIKELQPEKVDWASLFWFMVERELSQGLKLTDCYYASHLQYLMKSQKAEIVMEEPKVELKEDENPCDIGLKEEDNRDIEVKVGYDLKLASVNEFDGQDGNKLNTNLTLGQDKIENQEVKADDRMDIDESKEEPRQHRQWLFNGKNDTSHHFLQPCQYEEESRDLDSNEEERKREVEEEEEEDGFPIDPNENGPELGGLMGNFLQGMEETHVSFGLQRQLHDQFQTEIFPSRSSAHTISARPFYGNQEMLNNDEHNTLKHNLIGSNKRMRTENLRDQEPSEMGTIMEQIQHLAEKARIIYVAKEQTYQESYANQQILLNKLHQQDMIIEHMHKSKCEELQKKNAEIFKLERELYMMTNLLEGYRTTLKETSKAFSEYRQRAQLPEESVYKDAGPGGVVLGPIELEKQRVKQEEEDRLQRLIIEQKFKEIEEEWICKFEVELDKVQMMDAKLMRFENEVKLMKKFCEANEEILCC